jgi:hypothetical protein
LARGLFVEPGTWNRGTRYENPERKMPESVTLMTVKPESVKLATEKAGIFKTRKRKNPESVKPHIR